MLLLFFLYLFSLTLTSIAVTSDTALHQPLQGFEYLKLQQHTGGGSSFQVNTSSHLASIPVTSYWF